MKRSVSHIAFSKDSPVDLDKKANRNRYLEEHGHNMKGIGELGSSSDSSECSGFHNCRFGAPSIDSSSKRNFEWTTRVKR